MSVGRREHPVQLGCAVSLHMKIKLQFRGGTQVEDSQILTVDALPRLGQDMPLDQSRARVVSVVLTPDQKEYEAIVLVMHNPFGDGS